MAKAFESHHLPIQNTLIGVLLLIGTIPLLLGYNTFAEDKKSVLPIKNSLEHACEGEIPDIILTLEVTFSGVFSKREFKFPLKRSSPVEMDLNKDGIYALNLKCMGPIFSEHADSIDLKEHYAISIDIDQLWDDKAQLNVNLYWKTKKEKGKLDKKIKAPLYRSKEFTFRNGLIIKSYPSN